MKPGRYKITGTTDVNSGWESWVKRHQKCVFKRKSTKDVLADVYGDKGLVALIHCPDISCAENTEVYTLYAGAFTYKLIWDVKQIKSVITGETDNEAR